MILSFFFTNWHQTALFSIILFFCKFSQQNYLAPILSTQKPFSLPVQLVKSQIYIKKLRGKHSLEELYPHLEFLKAKYDWIRNPIPVEVQNHLNVAHEKRNRQYKKFDIVYEEKPQEIQKPPEKPKSALKQDPKLSVADLQVSKAPIQQEEPKKVNFLDAPAKSQATEVPSYVDPMALLNPDGSTMQVGEVTPCEFCGRRFGAEAMVRHVRVCLKNPARKANVKASTVSTNNDAK